MIRISLIGIALIAAIILSDYAIELENKVKAKELEVDSLKQQQIELNQEELERRIYAFKLAIMKEYDAEKHYLHQAKVDSITLKIIE